MTMAETVEGALSTWQPTGAGPHTMATNTPGWSVRATADKADGVGAVLHSLEVVRMGTAPAGVTTGSWANNIAKNAKGLLEPLRVIEVDTNRDHAVLRSEQPAVKGPNAQYYEMLVTGTDKAELKRFKADTAAHTPRESVPFALTHEVAGNLAAAVAGGQS